MSRTAVLRPRCWSGRKRTFSPCSNAHSRARWALEEVQIVPPCLPVNALMSADEFMYETGTTCSAIPASVSTSQHSATCSAVAMSAMEQPHGEVGEDHLLVVGRQDVRGFRHEVHTAEDDVLGLRARCGVAGQLEGVARDVGELDDLVALVVVAEHEDLVPEFLLGRAGPLHEVRVGRRGQVSGTLHAALAPRVGLTAEQQQGEGRRLYVELLGLGGGHDTHPFCSAARLDHGAIQRDIRTSLFVEMTLSIITASRHVDDGHSVDVT